MAETSILIKMCVCDFSERLVREREILQEQAEDRLEILKNLMKTTTRASPDAQTDMVLHSVFDDENMSQKSSIHLCEYHCYHLKEA